MFVKRVVWLFVLAAHRTAAQVFTISRRPCNCATIVPKVGSAQVRRRCMIRVEEESEQERIERRIIGDSCSIANVAGDLGKAGRV